MNLLLNTYNLTFGYEKIIRSRHIWTWSQVGNSITEDNAQITNGIVKFDYKIDTPWAT